MSDEGIFCDDPNHERCEKCSGCVPCGCLCHLAGDEERCQGCGHHEGEGCGCPPSAPLTLESMGLMAFREGEGLSCPKCHMHGIAVTYHEMIIFVTDVGGQTPCQEWVQKNLLGGTIGEHLCCRCQRCGYGFPMKTADS